MRFSATANKKWNRVDILVDFAGQPKHVQACEDIGHLLLVKVVMGHLQTPFGHVQSHLCLKSQGVMKAKQCQSKFCGYMFSLWSLKLFELNVRRFYLLIWDLKQRYPPSWLTSLGSKYGVFSSFKTVQLCRMLLNLQKNSSCCWKKVGPVFCSHTIVITNMQYSQWDVIQVSPIICLTLP